MAPAWAESSRTPPKKVEFNWQLFPTLTEELPAPPNAPEAQHQSEQPISERNATPAPPETDPSSQYGPAGPDPAVFGANGDPTFDDPSLSLRDRPSTPAWRNLDPITAKRQGKTEKKSEEVSDEGGGPLGRAVILVPSDGGAEKEGQLDARDLSSIDSLFTKSDVGETGKRFLAKYRENAPTVEPAASEKGGPVSTTGTGSVDEGGRSILLPRANRDAGIAERVLAWIQARKRAEARRKHGRIIAAEAMPSWGELAWDVLPTTPRTAFDWVAVFFFGKVFFMFYQLYRQYRIPVVAAERKEKKRRFWRKAA